MQIVTFYSFKGGTGRSMALANVAADLLSRGRRVLMVDFDLEAPGLDTFPITLNRTIDGGLVEMIAEYLTHDEAAVPSVLDYVYEASLESISTGHLWLMPAGKQDATYDSRFRRIDWQDFYDNQSGFLFFEDVKLQWKDQLNPDYVLIDSRTGHTDIGGICTRQLPDSVVAIFFPNAQNVRGLRPVVEDIRREKSGPLQRAIELHFVMGNVPDLDDEEAILAQACSVSEEMLGYSELAATIHHFNSMSMLEQRLLLVERPRSKIAGEYRQLASAIVKSNLEDRDGAIAILEQALEDLRSAYDEDTRQVWEEKLQKIRDLHSKDDGVLRHLARYRRAQRRSEEALDIYEQILTLNPNDAESLVGRADAFTGLKNVSGALEDLTAFFKLDLSTPFSFVLATRLLIQNDKKRLQLVIDSPAADQLPSYAISDIVHDLQRNYETAFYGVALIRKWIQKNTEGEEGFLASGDFSLALIATGEFEEAKKVIMTNVRSPGLDLADRFNYAMAEWGTRGETPRDLFEQVVVSLRDETEADHVSNPNLLQCASLAYWAVNNQDMADLFLTQAIERITSAPRSTFSAWSYLHRSPKSFRADLDAMAVAFRANEVRPLVFDRHMSPFPAKSLP